MSIAAKRYVQKRNIRHYHTAHMEEAYDAGANSNGKNYFTELSDQPIIAQLQQLTRLTFDGDLIGKAERDYLVERGFVQRFDGWNLATKEGIRYLQQGKFIHP